MSSSALATAVTGCAGRSNQFNVEADFDPGNFEPPYFRDEELPLGWSL
jgi:hypothetical protein